MDLRPVVGRMPWPEVRGKRCLDVGTYDGFLAFELERRGAREVVATDIADHEQWDWPLAARRSGPEYLARVAGPKKGLGFEIARRALASAVERQELSVYDLAPERVGEFDVVVCGSLLLHLQNPVKAVEAIRSVCAGSFLSAEQIDPWLTLVARRRPAGWFRAGELAQWLVPNAAAHRAIVASAGFAIERTARPYAVPVGAGHPPRPRDLRSRRDALLTRLVTGGAGVPHAAVLARAA
ncbi:MAG: class I SAM-dependent methyltransferase [Thermoleophilaceae bacterium]